MLYPILRGLLCAGAVGACVVGAAYADDAKPAAADAPKPAEVVKAAVLYGNMNTVTQDLLNRAAQRRQ